VHSNFLLWNDVLSSLLVFWNDVVFSTCIERVFSLKAY